MPFGDVTQISLTMNFDMVPGFIFWGTAPRHGIIPFIGIIEFRIDRQDHPMIIKLQVMDQLSDTKFRLGFLHYQCTLKLKEHSNGAVYLLGYFLFQAV